MKKFLQKYGLPEEQINSVLEAYKKDHADAKDLPEYIGKVRFDEVNTKLKASESDLSKLNQQFEDATKGHQKALEEAVKKATDELVANHTQEKEALIKDHTTEISIMTSRGRNVKAIKALIDPTKPIEEELARIKKSDSYLFEAEDDIPPGTGRHGDPGGADASEAEMQKMRSAVGIIG